MASDNTEPTDAPKGRYELRAPNPKFKGIRLGVAFENGVGYTDNLIRAKGVCEPVVGQIRFFTLTDHQTGKQLYPIPPGSLDPTKDDGISGNNDR